MSGRVCVICGDSFEKRPTEPGPHYQKRKTCSPECNAIRIGAHNRARNIAGRKYPDPTPKNCPQCNKEFSIRDGETRGDYRKRQTCSAECGARWSRRDVRKPLPKSWCPICGVEFEHGRDGHRKYCSKECQLKGREQQRLTQYGNKWCVVCGVEFSRRPDELNAVAYKRRKTCSFECRSRASGLARRNVIDRTVQPYPYEWNAKFRESIRIRDGYTCQLCGVTQLDRKHSVHHIDYNKQHCESVNLITLCLSCHTRTNGGDRKGWTEFFQAMMSESMAA